MVVYEIQFLIEYRKKNIQTVGKIKLLLLLFVLNFLSSLYQNRNEDHDCYIFKKFIIFFRNGIFYEEDYKNHNKFYKF